MSARSPGPEFPGRRSLQRPCSVVVAWARASYRLGSAEESFVDVAIVATVFPIIFLGELPDKTMFASLVMATKGKPRSVWLGAAGAFVVHVVIATTIGVGLFHLLSHRAAAGVVAALFAFGAVYAWREGTKDEEA